MPSKALSALVASSLLFASSTAIAQSPNASPVAQGAAEGEPGDEGRGRRVGHAQLVGVTFVIIVIVLLIFINNDEEEDDDVVTPPTSP
jgi:hypothetical protein